MNYIGSKFKLSSWIKEIIKTTTDKKNPIFCDLFAGTGIIGRVFKKESKKVIANDIEYYAYVLNRNYIGNHKNVREKLEIIEYLNTIAHREDGFIYNNYCSPAKRLYFSDENGKKIDAIRIEIEKFKDDEDTYFFLLASLLESADKVANTASVYGAFLKKLKKSALVPLRLEPAIYEENGNEHEVYQEDANTLIERICGDILYLDPPYNHRQYGANYHLLNTIAEYKPFLPKGVSGLRDYYKSSYCRRNEVKESFAELIEKANFRYIFLSYNNEGLMSVDEIANIMRRCGKYRLVRKEYSRYKADSNREYKRDRTYEYLHILQKD